MTTVREIRDSRLVGPWLAIFRTLWVAVVILSISFFVLGTVGKFGEPLPTNCARVQCNPIEITGDDVAVLRELALPQGLFSVLLPALNVLFNFSFIAVALVLFWLKADDWLALLLSATLAVLGGVAFSPANDVFPRMYPTLVPFITLLEIPAYLAAALLLLIFPDGRFVPRWTRWLVPLLLVSFLLQPLSNVLLVAGFLGFLVLAVLAQVHRYRTVSGPVQRQQTKWGLLGLLCIFGIMLSWALVNALFPPDQPTVVRAYTLLFLWPFLVALGLVMPGAFAVAILRYRLWDIDLIIRRTLLYMALTALLVLVYFGSVVLLQQLFRALSGQSSQLAVVLSTLAIAALFNPLRKRIQAAIDRGFYRRKYDADKTLAAFGAIARDEVDLEILVSDLIQVVEATVQPAELSLWLAPSSDEVNLFKSG